MLKSPFPVIDSHPFSCHICIETFKSFFMKTVRQSIAIVSMLLLMTGTVSSCKKSNKDEISDEMRYKMVLTTTRPEGDKVRLAFEAAAADQANIWIDLNNNKKRDTGEDVAFGFSIYYTVNASRTLTIYGKVSTLDCNNNDLTKLEVSGNSALKILHCGSNKIATMDVSGCPGLTELHCWVNQITTLNFTANKELHILSAYENQLNSTAMNNMINSLPARTTDAHAYLFNTQATAEGNTMPTAANTTTANGKKWKLYKHENFNWNIIP